MNIYIEFLYKKNNVYNKQNQISHFDLHLAMNNIPNTTKQKIFNGPKPTKSPSKETHTYEKINTQKTLDFARDADICRSLPYEASTR